VALTVEAVYENGVFKPAAPLPLKEHEKVRITVEQGESPLLRAYGIIGWTGDAETLERIALDRDGGGAAVDLGKQAPFSRRPPFSRGYRTKSGLSAVPSG